MTQARDLPPNATAPVRPAAVPSQPSRSSWPDPPTLPTGDWALLTASAGRRACKRGLDLLGAAIAIVLLSPLLVIVAAAIATTSRGGPLYRQVRVGREGRPFTIWKFRTMRRGAHDLMPEVVDLNELDGPIFKIRRDPRATPVGRFVRKFSLDELPQLVNVVRGDMSLVGPRPLVPEEYAHLDADQTRRLLARPGMTGTWQVSGRCDVDFARWMELDLDYIRHWSLRLDLQVLLRTIPAVLRARGSY